MFDPENVYSNTYSNILIKQVVLYIIYIDLQFKKRGHELESKSVGGRSCKEKIDVIIFSFQKLKMIYKP